MLPSAAAGVSTGQLDAPVKATATEAPDVAVHALLATLVTGTPVQSSAAKTSRTPSHVPVPMPHVQKLQLRSSSTPV